MRSYNESYPLVSRLLNDSGREVMFYCSLHRPTYYLDTVSLSRGVISIVGGFGFVEVSTCWSRGVFSECGEFGALAKFLW